MKRIANTHGHSKRLGLLVPLLFPLACGGVADEPNAEHARQVEEDIINGNAANAENSSFVRVSRSGGICSGTLLRNDVVLTARHCVTTDMSFEGPVDTTLSHYSLTMGSQVAGVSEVIANSPSTDTALLISDLFFNMNGANNGWSRQIYGGTNASLLGATLFCYGYGMNTYTDGVGPLRVASIDVTSTTGTTLTFSRNPFGQIQWHSDSGGGCLDSTLAATTVMSNCSHDPATQQVFSCNGVGAEAYRTWATDLMRDRAGAYVHSASAANIVANWTNLNHPDANGTPGALVHVTSNWNPGGAAGVYHNKNVGVWYTGSNWAIFNQDWSAMSAGVKFNVSVGGGFVHTATAGTISGHVTYINHSSLNGLPNATFSVTPNWNPGGAGGTYNNHPVGVWYDTGAARWTIFNQDFASMPTSAAFNIRVGTPNPGTPPAQYVHTATAATITGNYTRLNHLDINGQPNAKVFATANYNPGGVGGVYNNRPIGVWYESSTSRWAVFNQDLAAMPVNAAFNIMVRP